MNEADFYRRRIEYWQQKRLAAAADADQKAFDCAERELANYRAMQQMFCPEKE